MTKTVTKPTKKPTISALEKKLRLIIEKFLTSKTNMTLDPGGWYALATAPVEDNDKLCLFGVVGLHSFKGNYSMRHELDIKLGITEAEGGALEAGFCGWYDRREEVPEYYDLGAKLRNDYTEQVTEIA